LTKLEIMKIKPNSPCPCGSGKKAKKCCGVSNANINIDRLIDEIFSAVNSKKFPQAIAIFEAAPQHISRNNPELIKAYILGLIGIGHFEKAEELSKRFSSEASFLFSCGTLCYELKEFIAAINFLKKSLTLTPKDPNVLMNLAVTYIALKRYESALTHLRVLESIIGQNDSVAINQAICFTATNRYVEALDSLNQVSEQGKKGPSYKSAEAGYLLTQDEGDLAADIYRQLESDYPQHWKFTLERYKALIVAKKGHQVIEETKYENNAIRQNSFKDWIGVRRRAYLSTSKLTNFINELEDFKKALPSNPYPIEQLARVYEALGYAEGACQQQEALLALDAYDPGYLMWLLYLNTLGDEKILALHVKLIPIIYGSTCINERAAKRRYVKRDKIRVGYVSGDFRRHPVSDFFIPVLDKHNKNEVEVYCYSSTKREDKVTDQIKKSSDHWRGVKDLGALEIQQVVIDDELDVLVDLSGVTEDTKIGIFNCRLAPLQVSWLGYPFSTGIKNIDYKIVDEKTDPEGFTESFYSEKLYRLKNNFSVYSPPVAAKQAKCVAVPPSVNKGFVVFGSYNNLLKVTDDALHAWAKILSQVNESKLFFKAAQFKYDEAQSRVLTIFESHGVEKERIVLVKHFDDLEAHYASFNDVDINLDTFPYNGTTTTCEALYMGVPVIALEGKTHRSRVSYSILESTGAKELVAKNHDEYVKLAVALAKDQNRLKEYRKNIRSNFINSSVMDAKGFTKELEAAYKNMLTSEAINYSR